MLVSEIIVGAVINSQQSNSKRKIRNVIPFVRVTEQKNVEGHGI